MISAAATLLSLSEAMLWQGFLVFIRVGAMTSLLPAFGETSVPMRIKLGIAIAFTMIVAPAVPIMVKASFGNLVLFLFSEALIGLLLGIGVRLFVLALQTAGSIAAQATSLSQVFGNAGVEPMPAIGHVLVVAGLALAVMMDLHIRVAALLIASYDFFPFGAFPDASAVSEWGLSQIRHAFSLAFTLAAPFVIISLLYNLALGVINRAMPQLMVAFVGAPLITAGGLVLLCLLSPMILQIWVAALNGFLANPLLALP